MASGRRGRGRGRTPLRPIPTVDQRLDELSRMVADLAQTVAQVVRQGPQQQAAEPQPPPVPPPIPQPVQPEDPLVTRDVFDLLKLDPPRFSGDVTQMNPQRFVTEMEKLFALVHCPPDRRVPITHYLLTGAAEDWYRSWVGTRSRHLPPPTWDEFVEALYRQYFPESVRDDMAHQLMQLRMTSSMTVSEYAQEFDRLIAFAGERYPTEYARIREFIRGLPRPYLLGISVTSESTMSSVRNRALEIESGLKDPKGASSSGAGRKRTRGQPSRGGRGGLPPRPVSGMARTDDDDDDESRPRAVRRTGTDFSQSRTTQRRSSIEQHRADTRACYRCGRQDHFIRDCPYPPAQSASGGADRPATPTTSSAGSARSPADRGGRGRGRGRGSASRGRGDARVYAMTRQDAEASNAVVAGTLSVCSHIARVLFDPGATHSFISVCFALSLSASVQKLARDLCVSTPLGKTFVVSRVLPDCEIDVAGKLFMADLILLPMEDFDVILGMDWLAAHSAQLDCRRKTVCLQTPSGDSIVMRGSQIGAPLQLVSAVQAAKLVCSGCVAFLAVVRDVQQSPSVLEKTPVVCEFPDVFPEELPGLPPDREIEFCIDLVPGTQPISIPPYRMAPAELKELKIQLQELLDRGFI